MSTARIHDALPPGFAATKVACATSAAKTYAAGFASTAVERGLVSRPLRTGFRGAFRRCLRATRVKPWLFAMLAGGMMAAGAGCRPRPSMVENPVWRDGTMGTAYMVRLAGVALEPDEYVRVRQEFTCILEEIEDSMSNWRKDSELSRFNRLPPETPFPVSDPLAEVLRETHWIHERSGGAFDPTIAPLAALWGFGPGARTEVPPSSEDIAAAQQRVGWHHVRWQENPPALLKSVEGIELDLGGVAKGYAVDRVADYLRESGYTNFLVEVGGEIRAQGVNAAGDPWRVGIDMPLADAFPGESLAGVVHLTIGALATSGDYRRFVMDEEGVPLAHIMDPRSGRPIQRPASSVTVWTATAMRADGLSTAFYVLGREDGLALAESLDGVEVLFIQRGPDGTFALYPSSGFIETAQFHATE